MFFPVLIKLVHLQEDAEEGEEIDDRGEEKENEEANAGDKRRKVVDGNAERKRSRLSVDEAREVREKWTLWLKNGNVITRPVDQSFVLFLYCFGFQGGG